MKRLLATLLLLSTFTFFGLSSHAGNIEHPGLPSTPTPTPTPDGNTATFQKSEEYDWLSFLVDMIFMY